MLRPSLPQLKGSGLRLPCPPQRGGSGVPPSADGAGLDDSTGGGRSSSLEPARVRHRPAELGPCACVGSLGQEQRAGEVQPSPELPTLTARSVSSPQESYPAVPPIWSVESDDPNLAAVLERLVDIKKGNTLVRGRVLAWGALSSRKAHVVQTAHERELRLESGWCTGLRLWGRLLGGLAY